MPDYRLYSLDGEGKIVLAETFTATGDDEALMIARAAKKRVNCELWSRDRLVAKIPPFPLQKR
jgi:hypothetical protein